MGTRALLDLNHVEVATESESRKEALENEAKTVMFVAVGGEVAGMIAVADRVKPDSFRAVQAVKELGMIPVMITGDNERTARAIAAEVGIYRNIRGRCKRYA